MKFRSALVAAGATMAVAVGPVAFPTFAGAAPASTPQVYQTNIVATGSPSDTQDYVTYNGVTYFSTETADYGRAIYGLSSPGSTPALISHTDVGNKIGNSQNIFVHGHYLLYTNESVIYSVDLNTNTTTALDFSGSVQTPSQNDFSGIVNVGDFAYFIANAGGAGLSNELFSFNTLDGTLRAVSPVQLGMGPTGKIAVAGNKIYVQKIGMLYTFDTVSKVWSQVLDANGNAFQYGYVAGSYSYKGTSGVLLGQSLDASNSSPYRWTYTFVSADGTVTKLGNWSSFFPADFVNFKDEIYVNLKNIGGARAYLSKVGSDGSLVDVTSAVDPSAWQLFVGTMVSTGEYLVFNAHTDSAHTDYLLKWDGISPASRVTNVHSQVIDMGTNEASNFFAFPSNNNLQGVTDLGVVGNGVIASAFIDDAVGYEPYVFGLNGSVTLVKDFNPLTNGFDASYDCSASTGNTDYFIGKTATVKTPSSGSTPTLVSFTGGSHKLFYKTTLLSGLSSDGTCGFVSIGGQTYFNGNSPDLGHGLYRVESNGSLTRLFSLADGTYQPAFTEGTNYFYIGASDRQVHRVDISALTDKAITGQAGSPIVRLGWPSKVVVVGSTAYFTAALPGWAYALVSLDLSDPDSVPKVIGTPSSGSYSSWEPYNLAFWNGKVIFSADDGTSLGGGSVFALDPANNAISKLFDIPSAYSGVFRPFTLAGDSLYLMTWVNNANGFGYLRWSNGLEPSIVSPGFNPDCVGYLGNEVAMQSPTGRIYLYDNAGNLIKEDSGVGDLCGAVNTANGSYFSGQEYNYTGNHVYNSELRYYGLLVPVATSRLGTPVNELPAQPFNGGTPIAETEVPGVPTNVTGLAVDSQINLTWDAPTTGGAARDYTVTNSPAGAVCTTDGTSAVCTGMTAGTTYTFSVSAVNGAGSSAPSTSSAGVVAPMAAQTPSVDGIVRVTQTISAGTAGWSSGISLQYQWMRDGVAISGATGKKYRIAAGDLGHKLSVVVTGSRAGLVSRSLTSAAYKVGTAVVTIYGAARIGSKLTSDPGIWPVGTALTYQWLANKTVVGYDATYTITSNDALNRMSLAVTGTIGGRQVTKISKPTAKVLQGMLTLTPVPTIRGENNVGGWLCARAGIWDDNVDVNFQWFRNGYKIDGETSSCYYPGPSDLGQMITVKTTGSKYNYIPKTMTSLATRILRSQFMYLDTPVILGSATVGTNLTTDIGSMGWWGANISYQWLDNGKKIAGATSDNYTVTAKNVGHIISVRVTMSLPYYDTASQTSDPVGPVTN